MAEAPQTGRKHAGNPPGVNPSPETMTEKSAAHMIVKAPIPVQGMESEEGDGSSPLPQHRCRKCLRCWSKLQRRTHGLRGHACALTFELFWRAVPQGRVQSLTVVVPVDELFDVGTQVLHVVIMVCVNFLPFQCLDERLT